MSTSIFLKIDTIDGESSDSKHQKWIELEYINFGVANHARIADSGKRKITMGTADFRSIECLKTMDSSSVKLLSAVSQGSTFKTIQLEICCMIKGTLHPYANIDLEECAISAISETCSKGGGYPQEQFTITFSKIKWTFTPIKDDGSAGSKVGPEGWNLIENIKQ